MLTHGQVWGALDRLAAQYGLSASGLAKRAGLDATSFNRSKRITPDGRPRWPSTESVAKVLAATGASVEDFTALLDGPAGSRTLPRTLGFSEEPAPPPARAIPHIGLAQAGKGGFFDDAGFPAGSGWDEILFPAVEDEHAYALEISGDSMQPLYRDGDIVIVSPAASVRRGDRVIVKTRDGQVLAKELVRRTARTVELRSLNPEHEDVQFPLSDVVFIARIVWATQ
ncbi:S24 family peptidase [Aquabacter spiritensis]|uniref:Phage repressor protein C with HTH and peptisase S24 domain n=1 Tax=Aquabacter spiritensis TaxID=933073 RepID=A0A4R3M154_9HYPH|nr:helix-turn-helix transcriptional regulator [Aquabacter spiritensis]TCT06831.1 phage repressor protein C with HTH and peptisase S24 domain [Aquabacter spiritensis]